MIIDGVFFNEVWVLLFGDWFSLIYINFFKDEVFGFENDRVNICLSSFIYIVEYDWIF